MDENAEAGVTFGEILKAIKRRIWLVAGATVALTALIVLSVVFWWNPSVGAYSLTFGLAYPDSDSLKYPDGTPFYYQEIVSLDNLVKAKESDGRFAGINVERLYEKDGISVTMTQSADTERKERKYVLSAKASYFSGKTAATEFLRALARQAVLRAVESAKEISYALDQSAFAGADFEGKIALLVRQKEDLLARYDEWIALYSGSYTVAGKTLINHRAEVDVLFGTATQEALLDELETNGYVSSELLEAKRKALEAEKAENAAKIEALKAALKEAPAAASFTVGSLSASASASATAQQLPLDLSETLAALLVRNVQIDGQLGALTEENVAAFAEKLNATYLELQERADKAQAVGTALYEQEARVHFESAQAAESGGVNVFLAVVGGFVLSLFVVCIVVCATELSKRRKQTAQEKTEKENQEGTE